MADIHDADIDSFFDLCAASSEGSIYPSAETRSASVFESFEDAEHESEACVSECEDISRSYGFEYDSPVGHSDEGSPASDWSSATLECSGSLSDASTLSINPSLLVKAANAKQPSTPRDSDLEDLHSCSSRTTSNLCLVPDPVQAPRISGTLMKSEHAVTGNTSADDSDAPQEAVSKTVKNRKAVAQRHRPRTRQYVRIARQSSVKDEDSDSEYLGSDSGDSADEGVHCESSTRPSKRRRKADFPSKSPKRIRCQEPFCSRSFTRPADLRRHVATIHQDLSRREVMKETREEYRLWCKKCEAILGRVDARQRHESHGSCSRSLAIMEARIRNGTIRGRASRGQLK
ncbi:hypothetical protein F5I97DRAFT_19745 [Phlebopus sp. FC_14]|nr:hypothetical protein F5I97DRAFT_19745 [Phlebopus sp. FC_14]